MATETPFLPLELSGVICDDFIIYAESLTLRLGRLYALGNCQAPLGWACKLGPFLCPSVLPLFFGNCYGRTAGGVALFLPGYIGDTTQITLLWCLCFPLECPAFRQGSKSEGQLPCIAADWDTLHQEALGVWDADDWSFWGPHLVACKGGERFHSNRAPCQPILILQTCRSLAR